MQVEGCDGAHGRTLSLEQRLKFAQAEIEIVQSRFDKFDQMFLGNRRLAVTITAAAFATSAALDQKVALFAASGVSVMLLFLEAFHRKNLFAKLVERHLILRAALNEPEALMRTVVYDPFNDMGVAVPEKWHQEKSFHFSLEMIIFYLVVIAIPIILAVWVPSALHH